MNVRNAIGILVFAAMVVFFMQCLEAQSVFSVNDAKVAEGVFPTGPSAVFTIIRSGPGAAATISYFVEKGNGTASENFLGSRCDGGSVGSAGRDFEKQAKTLQFGPSETAKTVSVVICGDSTDEPDETFFIGLLNPFGGTIGDGQGKGIIVDNDQPPGININDVAINEGNSGQATATFQLSLTAESEKTITINAATANDTASGGANCGSGSDFINFNNTVTFGPFDKTKTVTVPVCGDSTFESTERFKVSLSAPSNVNIVDGAGLGTINTDDAAPVLSVADITINEVPAPVGTRITANFTFHLSSASPESASVTYSLGGGTAKGFKLCTEGFDYLLASGVTVTFASNETTKTVPVTICSDLVDEPAETFVLTLSAPQRMTLQNTTAKATIVASDI